MFKNKIILLIALLLTQSFAAFPQSQNVAENWKQYSSSMAGYAIEYTLDWQVSDEEAKGQVWRVAFASPGTRDRDVTNRSSIFICSKPKNALFKILSDCREHDDHLSGNYKNKIIAEKSYNLNGI